jgi:hypothetical protein
MDEHGWPIATRVGRHTSSIAQTLETWSEDHPDRAVKVRDIPRYKDLVAMGVGAFLRNPASVAAARLAYE